MTDWTPAGESASDADSTDVQEPGDATTAGPAGEPAREVDLDRIERDLEGVEVALQRLDAGTYWTDEVTGEALPDDLLEHDPTARRRA